jgi:hypothetical protein
VLVKQLFSIYEMALYANCFWYGTTAQISVLEANAGTAESDRP